MLYRIFILNKVQFRNTFKHFSSSLGLLFTYSVQNNLLKAHCLYYQILYHGFCLKSELIKPLLATKL